MEILLWLLPAALATVGAMIYVSIVGHEKRPTSSSGRTEAQQAKFAAAMQRPQPGNRVPRQRAVGERSTGVAARRRP